MTIALITHPDCILHDIGDWHPEQPARLKVIEDALSQSGLVSSLKKFLAPLATRDQLLRVHDVEYIDRIFQLSPQENLISLDLDTLMNPHTLTAALRASGATVSGVDLVMSGEVKAAFCNVRPPGHHAERSRAMGFCIFNNVAVGVAHALEYYKLQRIAIVDFDVHHGNGTENIFENDERVLLCSFFQHPFYPFSGSETKSDHIINLPLPAGTTGTMFRKKTEEFWLEAIHRFKPEMIFFSAGFDGHMRDPMSNVLLNEDDYAWLSREIKLIADSTCQGRIVSALEGGYSLEVLGPSVVAHIRGLLD
ncbi:MAG: histone deacetylase family protein [Gammaproteobacteria bacterium]|nr:histone deacetylase family protein [Gammaproteobacteria bacterium]